MPDRPGPRGGRPQITSCNGDLLIELCKRNNLIICNTTNLCQGAITRQRSTINRIEKSILDYFILCKEMFTYLSSMQIDEARAFVLTKYSKAKGKVKITESDHNPLICKFDLLWSDKMDSEKQRYEIFNFKDPEGVIKFKELTSSNTLLNCVQGNVKQSSKKWLKAFNNILHRLFKKIIIGKKQILVRFFLCIVIKKVKNVLILVGKFSDIL